MFTLPPSSFLIGLYYSKKITNLPNTSLDLSSQDNA